MARASSGSAVRTRCVLVRMPVRHLRSGGVRARGREAGVGRAAASLPARGAPDAELCLDHAGSPEDAVTQSRHDAQAITRLRVARKRARRLGKQAGQHLNQMIRAVLIVRTA